MQQRPKPRLIRLFVGLAFVLIALRMNFVLMQPTPYDLRVFGQQELAPGTTASLRAVLLDRRTDQPLPGEEINLRLHNPKSEKSVDLGSYVTGPHGTGNLSFNVPAWADGNYELIAETGGHVSREAIRLPITLRKTLELTLVTDRPIYKPGQTIHLRLLARRRSDRVPAGNENAVFTLRDPRDNIMFKQQVQTSQFGIASADCELAHELIEGDYVVECSVGTEQTRVPIQIKTYVLPKFNVAIETDRSIYQPGQLVSGTVTAKYHFGKPAVGAKVEVFLRQRDGKMIGIVEHAVTDGNGLADFSRGMPDTLHDDSQLGGPIEMNVSVTDTTGEVIRQSRSITLTRQLFRIEIIPEANRLLPGTENVIYLLGRDPQGRAVPFVANVGGIEEPITSSSLGVASFKLKCDAEQMQLHVRARDLAGNQATAERLLVTNRRDDAFVLRTDRVVFSRGQPIGLEIHGLGDKPVMVDVLRDGVTVATHAVPVSGGRGSSVLTLPEQVSGTLELVAYRMGSQRWPARQVSLIEVRADGALNIEMQTDQKTYRPGERAIMTLSLSDDQGKPTTGAISLAAVDEAVFSLAMMEEASTAGPQPQQNESLEATLDHSDESAQLQRDQAMAIKTVVTRSDREAILQRLIDEEYLTEEYLDVLNDPDREAIAERIGLESYPQDVQDIILEQGRSIHSLSGSSFSEKELKVLAHRAAALQVVDMFLIVFVIVFGVLFVITLLIWLVSNSPSVFVGLVVLGVAVLIIGILLPSLGAARRTARRMQNGSNMRGIATAIELMRESDGAIGRVGNAATPIRVRKHFPETLLWKPQLITDDTGKVTLDVELADSITTWRVQADAVSLRGSLGSLSSRLRVFQPFFVDVNLPATLTRGDRVTLPIVLYNYLAAPQDVALTIRDASWFELTEKADVLLASLKPNEVRTVHVPIHILEAGAHRFEIIARGSDESDAVQRTINVLPEGVRIDRVASGTLERSTEVVMHVPKDAVDGSVRGFLKLYPSNFSQVVEGLDAIVGRPHGCFEQASSTTYPNLLILDYLQRTNAKLPRLEANAKQFIHLGYQQLLAFEVDGGGFDWFGVPPANRILTAYGLMEFVDMAKVYPVDPALIDRTQQWLMKQRRPDGSWSPESHSMESGPHAGGSVDERVVATAYIAWALAHGSPAHGSADRMAMDPTRSFLLNVKASDVNDAYLLAMICNALLAIDNDPVAAQPYLDRLLKLKQVASDGKSVWWTRSGDRRTAFHGGGKTAAIETTSLATLALIHSNHSPETVRRSLHWLVAQKDPDGGWHATQSTVLALKALLAGTTAAPEMKVCDFEVLINGDTFTRIHVPADQAEVLQLIDLTKAIDAGDTRVSVRPVGETSTAYQLAWRYNLLQPESPGSSMSIQTTFPKERIAVGDRVQVESIIANKSSNVAPMLVAHLPIPAGFRLDASSVEQLKKAVAKCEQRGHELVVYLRRLDANAKVTLRYNLLAGEPVDVAVPASRVYHYYDPDQHAVSSGARVVIRPRVN